MVKKNSNYETEEHKCGWQVIYILNLQLCLPLLVCYNFLTFFFFVLIVSFWSLPFFSHFQRFLIFFPSISYLIRKILIYITLII